MIYNEIVDLARNTPRNRLGLCSHNQCNQETSLDSQLLLSFQGLCAQYVLFEASF